MALNQAESVNMLCRVPLPLLPKVEKDLKNMLSPGIIEKDTEPTDWCAPMVLAPKHNEEEVRVRVDLNQLNEGVNLHCIHTGRRNTQASKYFLHA